MVARYPSVDKKIAHCKSVLNFTLTPVLTKQMRMLAINKAFC